MLSEIAISDPKAFSNLVQVARDGKAGKVVAQEKSAVEEVVVNGSAKKTAKKAADTKKEAVAKKDVKEAVDYSKMTVAELKELAKKAGIKGITSMKKQELVDALQK